MPKLLTYTLTALALAVAVSLLLDLYTHAITSQSHVDHEQNTQE